MSGRPCDGSRTGEAGRVGFIIYTLIYLQENNAAKWFCGFALSEKTPDYSLFTRVRKRDGAGSTSRSRSFGRCDRDVACALLEVRALGRVRRLLDRRAQQRRALRTQQLHRLGVLQPQARAAVAQILERVLLAV